MKSECKYSFLEAKAKIEAYCAYQERCQFEVRKKLISWGVDFEDQDRLIAHLIEHRFLDEERFAEAYVSGKFRIKKWGRVKIKMHLKQLQISAYSIKKGISTIDGEEYWNTLLYLADKKNSDSLKEQDPFKRKAKVMRFLQSKGYENDLIYEAWEELNS